MNRPLAAVVGGAVGTTVMSVVLAMVEVEARYAIGLFDAIARFARVPGEPVLGFLIYAVVGVFAWPLLFLSLEQYVPLDLDPAVAGMGMGAVLWLPFVLLGSGEVGGDLFVLVYLPFTLLAHLAYGFTMGAVYARLAGEGLEEDASGGTSLV